MESTKYHHGLGSASSPVALSLQVQECKTAAEIWKNEFVWMSNIRSLSKRDMCNY